MSRKTKRIAFAAALLLLITGLVAAYASYATHTQQRRAEFERYLYRAVENCQSGNSSGVYVLLSRAGSVAPTPADEQYALDLIPKFRAGDCRLTTDTSSDGNAIPLP